MFLTGIIAEFNPLHKGHEYLIKKAKEKGAVACVISGNFVQRGDTAIAEKGIRAKAALKAGADLVIELPVLWSMSTAQNFALGGVSALYFAGCKRIMFGSESGDIKSLYKTAEILLSDEFKIHLENELSKGITFAKARQNAAELCGCEKDILSGANNNLGIEYIIAAKTMGYDIEFEAISRKGAAHDSKIEDEFVSASLLRERLLLNDIDFAKKYMPENSNDFFKKNNLSDINRIDRAILCVLRTKTLNDFIKLPDLSEGVENKLFSCVRVAKSLDELYNSIKVKRYTMARIRRLCLSAFLGFDSSFFMKPLPYLRVLGLNDTGKEILSKNLSNSPVSVVARTSDIKKLPEEYLKVFETECLATDLFSMSLIEPMPCGAEYTRKIIFWSDKND